MNCQMALDILAPSVTFVCFLPYDDHVLHCYQSRQRDLLGLPTNDEHDHCKLQYRSNDGSFKADVIISVIIHEDPLRLHPAEAHLLCRSKVVRVLGVLQAAPFRIQDLLLRLLRRAP